MSSLHRTCDASCSHWTSLQVQLLLTSDTHPHDDDVDDTSDTHDDDVDAYHGHND